MAFPSSYKIVISEAQRKLLVEALHRCPSKVIKRMAKGADELETLDLYDLVNMLQDLPTEECIHPGIVHGLCV